MPENFFKEFFNNCEIHDLVTVSEGQSEKISSSLQKRLADNYDPQSEQHTKEKKTMKKTTTIRTLIIAAAIAIMGALSIVGAASTILTKEQSWEDLTREQIRNELAEKNSYTEEFSDKLQEWKENAGRDVHVLPSYKDVVVTELIVTEANADDLKGMALHGIEHGIMLSHEDSSGRVAYVIVPDGKGGYMYDPSGKIVEDEQILAAIAEGTERYGDTFTIYY